eukprot:353774-Chlamydomonas_euryale.AAC.7
MWGQQVHAAHGAWSMETAHEWQPATSEWTASGASWATNAWLCRWKMEDLGLWGMLQATRVGPPWFALAKSSQQSLNQLVPLSEVPTSNPPSPHFRETSHRNAGTVASWPRSRVPPPRLNNWLPSKQPVSCLPAFCSWLGGFTIQSPTSLMQQFQSVAGQAVQSVRTLFEQSHIGSTNAAVAEQQPKRPKNLWLLH